MVDSPVLESVKVSVEGAVARITLDRPQRRNALDVKTLLELETAARFLDGQADVRVVHLSGNGPCFAAGADLKELTHELDAAPQPILCDAGRRASEAIAQMRALTIASVHGYCVGGGVVLAAACDFRIAARDAIFWIPELELGIPLAWGGVPRLLRELGPAVTKDLVLTCRKVKATDLPAGFLYEVCDLDMLGSAADALAEVLRTRPQFSAELSKRHINRLSEQISSTADSEFEAYAFMTALQDSAVRQAIDAYANRFSS